MANSGIRKIVIKKMDKAADAVEMEDALAMEEPMEIRLLLGPADNRTQKNLSVTMRTPGNDAELAMGFLYTEGIVVNPGDVIDIRHYQEDENVVVVTLGEDVALNMQQIERHFYTTSSCGVCGKSSIEAIRTIKNRLPAGKDYTVSPDIIYQLPGQLNKLQNIFEETGGLHASALFDLEGNHVLIREDVGRHNALDKLIGAMLNDRELPLNDSILLLSGRASFELIQKAAMAGIKTVAAIGAPSSLAVELAKDQDITLVGFLRKERFNIYSGSQRIVF